MILKFSFVQAEHFCVDYDSPDIRLSNSAKSLVFDDLGTERAALFSFNFKGRACGRKQVGRSLFDQRTMLNGEICRPIDLS
jgi:hypothetical protein